MRKEGFQVWLSQVKGLQASTVGSRLSNCDRIEAHEGDLDALFEQDRFSSLLNRLAYSKEDQRGHQPPRHAVPIDGDIYNGTATLRSAARLYYEFANSDALPFNSPIPQTLKKRIGTSGDWPTWEVPSSEAILMLIRMVTPYVRFLNPSIVAQIVEDNERNRVL